MTRCTASTTSVTSSSAGTRSTWTATTRCCPTSTSTPGARGRWTWRCGTWPATCRSGPCGTSWAAGPAGCGRTRRVVCIARCPPWSSLASGRGIRLPGAQGPLRSPGPRGGPGGGPCGPGRRRRRAGAHGRLQPGVADALGHGATVDAGSRHHGRGSAPGRVGLLDGGAPSPRGLRRVRARGARARPTVLPMAVWKPRPGAASVSSALHRVPYGTSKRRRR